MVGVAVVAVAAEVAVAVPDFAAGAATVGAMQAPPAQGVHCSCAQLCCTAGLRSHTQPVVWGRRWARHSSVVCAHALQGGATEISLSRHDLPVRAKGGGATASNTTAPMHPTTTTTVRGPPLALRLRSHDSHAC